MSQEGDDYPLELHIFSPSESAEIVEILYAVAHYHRTGAPLRLWNTVNFGRPWLNQSRCDYGLISLPYLDGPGLEKSSLVECSFYWLIPITVEELRFKKEQGVEALEQQFERAGFNYADPARPSVV